MSERKIVENVSLRKFITKRSWPILNQALIALTRTQASKVFEEIISCFRLMESREGQNWSMNKKDRVEYIRGNNKARRN